MGVPRESRDLTTEEAAEYLAVSERQLYRLALANGVRRVRFGHRSVRWPVSELNRVRNAHTTRKMR